MLHIKNGTLVTGEGLKKASLWVRDGKIAQIGGDLQETQVLDAAGMLVFPGFIDAHTHLQMDTGTAVTADSFETGTAAALAGGTTAIIDFATQERGKTLREAFETWSGRAAGHCSCDWGLHMAVTGWSGQTRSELADMARLGVTSLKAYMAYDSLRIADSELRSLMEAGRELGLITGVHCELGDEVNRGIHSLLEQGCREPKYHPLSRPAGVEALAVRRALQLARQADAPLWVVHLSTKSGLQEIRAAREAGQRVLVETCPQYLTLNDAVYAWEGFEAAKFICSPPVRGEEDRQALLDALLAGEIDIVSTDHCSFNFKGQKELGRNDFSMIPNGLPGIEHRPMLVWSACGPGPQRMAKALSENPARAFGLYPRKGALQPGSDADLVIWDPAGVRVITAADQVQNVDYTPWEGFRAEGVPRQVYLGGELCAEYGRVIRGGRGRYLPRASVW